MPQQRDINPGLQLARALWFSAPRSAELRSEVVPPPGPRQLRVQALASAISHGSELLVYRGQVLKEMALDLPTLAGSFAFPIKYGYAVVGRVTEVGAGVGDFEAGDSVFVLHPHQSLFLAPAELAIRLPAIVDPLAGLFYANLETALNIVHDTPLRLGETVLLFGQGTVGLLVLQLLRIAGAGQVIVVEPVARRRSLALALGADAALAADSALAAQVHALTAGRGADVAIEVSGVPDALQAALDLTAQEGTVVVASWYGVKPVTLDLGSHFHRGRLRLRSSQVGQLNPDLAPRWDRARRSATVLALLPRLRLRELISHRIAFDQAPSAYTLIDTQPEQTIQVVLTYQS